MRRSQLLMTALTQLVVWSAGFSSVPFAAPNSSEQNARQIVLLPPSGAEPADREILRWQSRIIEQPTESANWERLGWAYIAKARRTQDSGFYKLAQLTVEAWETTCGSSGEARLLRGHVYHNLHRFKEAEEIARTLSAERKSPADYALLSDALMEQGKLEEAVQACQVLTDLRPGVESYSRIAHLRWLFGDLDGALTAIELAIRTSDLRDQETSAWLYSRLAGFELVNGRVAQALAASDTALSGVADYPLALAVKGRALYASGDYNAALVLLRRASESNPIPENQWWLADALRARGQEQEAKSVEAQLRRHGGVIDPRTFALFLATRGEGLDRAISLATEELANRSDIFTRDALAFAFLRSGQLSAATAEMRRAMVHQTADPRLALHAGILAEETGDAAAANICYRRASAMAAALTPSEQELLSVRLGMRL